MINLLANISELILGVTCVFCSYREESYKTVILHSDPGDPQPPTFNNRFKMFTAIYNISCHNKPCSVYVAIDFTLHDSGVSWLLFVYYLPCHIENSYLFGTSQPSAFVYVCVLSLRLKHEPMSFNKCQKETWDLLQFFTAALRIKEHKEEFL